MEWNGSTVGRRTRFLIFFALASSALGCDRGPSIEQARERARAVVTEAESQADALSSNWPELVADVKAAAIVPELETPCAADARPTPAMRAMIAMSTGISSMGTESLLDRRIPAGSYYVTRSKELDESYSPTAAKIREVQRVKPDFEVLIVIDEVQAPKITDRVKSLFQPGYAIGRAYLLDHEPGKTLCFASVMAPNSPHVETGGELDRAFLEMDLAKAVFKTVDEHWVAARKP